MAESKYEQIYEGQWFAVPRKNWQLACCSCSLVHIYDFRIRKGKLEIRIRVDNRATGQYRRQEEAREAKGENE